MNATCKLVIYVAISLLTCDISLLLLLHCGILYPDQNLIAIVSHASFMATNSSVLIVQFKRSKPGES